MFISAAKREASKRIPYVTAPGHARMSAVRGAGELLSLRIRTRRADANWRATKAMRASGMRFDLKE